jgi:hypothetical protein
VRFFALILLTVLAGCQFDPFTAIYTRKQPKPEDLVGTYLPDDATRTLVAKEGGYSAAEISIVVSADGTLIIRNIPDWWLTDFGKPQGGFDSGEAKWAVQKRQDWWVIGVNFRSTEKFSSQQRRVGTFGTELFLIGEKPPYKIHLIVGDPDEGRGMEFVRSKI